ncbi:hypothetical protein GGR58DRAFT_354077 [Xylaria digitata]|nr:hypothetical protein GGR58DRAFT_354077 [Xylaria digitata]
MSICVRHSMDVGLDLAPVANSLVDGCLEIKVFLAGPFCIPALCFVSFFYLGPLVFLGLYVFEIEWLWGIALTTLVDVPIGVDVWLLIADSTLLFQRGSQYKNNLGSDQWHRTNCKPKQIMCCPLALVPRELSYCISPDALLGVSILRSRQ